MSEKPTGERVFVFGSNLAGVHGAGSAKAAATKHGAKRGVGSGRTGNAYAIPTKATWRSPALPLDMIAAHIREFIRYVGRHPEITFDVVRVGCGLAGYEDSQIAPLFANAPRNVYLPFGWREFTSTPPQDTPS